MTSEAIEQIWLARERLEVHRTERSSNLADAAICHAMTRRGQNVTTAKKLWPFKPGFKPSKTELESLADAAAYLCAAIERILEEGGAQ
jgi:hypothetical protein